MKLPALAYTRGTRRTQMINFGGLNHNLGARDGEIYDMGNLWSEYFPLLSTRPERLLYKRLTNGNSLFAWKELCWTDGKQFFFGGEAKGEVSEGEKSFAAMGEYIVIFPDKKYYDTVSDTVGSLEAKWSGNDVQFKNGELYGVPATANTIEVPGETWADFKPGDAVFITGCTVHPENNKSIIIRDIQGGKLVFYENSFKLSGDEGKNDYTEPGPVSIARNVPDILYICENEGRLWGCDKTTIYASKVGSIFNWNVFDGLDSDSWTLTPGSAGYFTGCVSFGGYPVFFKPDHIYKVYGEFPSNFKLMGNATLGLSEGSSKSFAIAGETLYYLSTSGIMAYSGGLPAPISHSLGPERLENAVGGTDGLKYYISVKHEDGSYKLHVYDTQRRTWHTEDNTRARGFAMWHGNLYFLNDKGEIWIEGKTQNPPEAAPEGAVEWFAEFADWTEKNPGKNSLNRLLIKAALAPDSELRAYIMYDSDLNWQLAGSAEAKIGNQGIQDRLLPIRPNRAEHYRLRLEGRGQCKVYSITREFYSSAEI